MHSCEDPKRDDELYNTQTLPVLYYTATTITTQELLPRANFPRRIEGLNLALSTLEVPENMSHTISN